ncbi:hypothetical protein DE146DRAFT_649275 [Phaeosphaeria sp. MPI-PUGE-AT-0046c]|nr:hypothetical protein DE146DRAFT_649275 [Phaeosphaeria sp. MPI-PUGE-AT-0046c]
MHRFSKKGLVFSTVLKLVLLVLYKTRSPVGARLVPYPQDTFFALYLITMLLHYRNCSDVGSCEYSYSELLGRIYGTPALPAARMNLSCVSGGAVTATDMNRNSLS